MDPIGVLGLLIAALGVPAALVAWHSHRRQAAGTLFDHAFRHLQTHQAALRDQALSESPAQWKSDLISLLVKPNWILTRPIPFEQVELNWSAPPPKASGVSPPAFSFGTRMTYSEALAKRPDMAGLFNGVVYRPLGLEIQDEQLRMLFTEGRYFDYLDSSEVLAHEAAARHIALKSIASGRCRRSIADPFDLSSRPTSLGINTLTIRRASVPPHGFFMHKRSDENMANETQLVHVIPAGEFTPSDVSFEATLRDFDLSRNVIREYAEEFLSVDDAQGKGGRTIDFAAEPPFADLEMARREGRMQLYVLGLALDPLCWKPELLTVCLFEPATFDTIFANISPKNREGVLISGRNNAGIPFTEANVRLHADHPDMSRTGAACLKLAWRFRGTLGLK